MGATHSLIARRVVAPMLAIVCATMSAQADTSDWRYSATFYGWLTSLSSSIGTPLGTVDVEQSFSDVLGQLDFSAFGSFEARRGRWGLIADVAHAELSQTQSLLPGAPFGGVRVDTRITALSGYVAYRVAESKVVSLDLAGGVRHYHMSLRASLTGPDLNLRVSDQWVDPVIGARVVWTFADDWRGAASLDAGGFGIGNASDFSWQATAEAEYSLNERWSVLLGYRHLSIDRPTDRQTFKLDVSGPVIGIRARF